jgi:hypothetical protein
MTEDILHHEISREEDEEIREGLLSSPTTRGTFLKGAAIAAASFGLTSGIASAAGLGSATRGGSMKESPQTIFNIAATAEAAAVTALYNVHVAVGQGKLATSGIHVPVDTLVRIVRAALREEQDHLAFVMGAGGKPLYTSFSFPMAIFTNAVQTLKFFETAESVFIAAYMAANREFASGGHNKLAQYTYQIGGTECEHRTLMRAGLGELPPNNKSFETNMFAHVSGAARVLGQLGIFKPSMAMPSAADVNKILATTVTKDATAGVIQRHP